jgi:hypothetical protein
MGAVNSRKESFIEVSVVPSSLNQLVLVVATAPDIVLAAVDIVLPPADATVLALAPATELIGADPNTSLRPPLAINDPAAVITIEVIALLHAMSYPVITSKLPKAITVQPAK